MTKKKNALVAYKELYGYSWKELSKKTGLAISFLRGVASGTHKDLKISTINKIRKVTKLEPSDYIE